MVLRLILVSLVASMGFEAPSSQTVESWNRSGREWASARLDDFSALTSRLASAPAEEPTTRLVEGEEAPTRTEVASESRPGGSPVDDLTFEVLVEGMAVRFGDELAMAQAEAAKVAVVEEATPVVVEAASIPVPVPVVAEALPTPVVSEVGETSRSERISKAVVLTRHAWEAWASLIAAPEVAQGNHATVMAR